MARLLFPTLVVLWLCFATHEPVKAKTFPAETDTQARCETAGGDQIPLGETVTQGDEECTCVKGRSDPNWTDYYKLYHLECPSHIRENAECNAIDRHGTSWNTTDADGKISVCRCGYASILGLPGPFGKICVLQGCETYESGYIPLGKTVDRDGVTCKCVKGRDPTLMDDAPPFRVTCAGITTCEGVTSDTRPTKQWREVDVNKREYQCRCGLPRNIMFPVPISGPVNFMKICQFEGCITRVESVYRYIPVNGTVEQDGVMCRCVEEQDPNLMDTFIPYHVKCPLPIIEIPPPVPDYKDPPCYGKKQWTQPGKPGMPDTVCFCNYTFDEMGRLVSVKLFCKVYLGCVGQADGWSEARYIRPGKVVQIEGDECRCVVKPDSKLRDYHLKCLTHVERHSSTERVNCALVKNQNLLHHYPGDKAQYIQCGRSGSTWDMPCAPGTWFSFETQRCSLRANGK